MSDHPTKNSFDGDGQADEPHIQRRQVLKTVVAGSAVATGLTALPEVWIKPELQSVLLPAHAASSTEVQCEVEIITNTLEAPRGGRNDVNTPFTDPWRGYSYFGVRVMGRVIGPGDLGGIVIDIVAEQRNDADGDGMLTAQVVTNPDGTYGPVDLFDWGTFDRNEQEACGNPGNQPTVDVFVTSAVGNIRCVATAAADKCT